MGWIAFGFGVYWALLCLGYIEICRAGDCIGLGWAWAGFDEDLNYIERCWAKDCTGLDLVCFLVCFVPGLFCWARDCIGLD